MLTYPFNPKSDTAVWDKSSCLTLGQCDKILNAYTLQIKKIKLHHDHNKEISITLCFWEQHKIPVLLCAVHWFYIKVCIMTACRDPWHQNVFFVSMLYF